MKKRRYLMIGMLLLVLLGAFLTMSIVNSRRVMMQLIKEQARSFLSIVASTQENSIFAEGKYEDAFREQLINICNYLETRTLNAQEINRVRQNFQINAITVRNPGTYRPIISSGTALKPTEKKQQLDKQERVFFDYFTIGSAKYMRFLFQAENRLYEIEVSAEEIQSFRREFGVHKIIQQISLNPIIEYLVLQDKEGILFATPNVQEITRIKDDPDLLEVLDHGNELSRIAEFDNIDVLELARPFQVNNEIFGIFRIGIKLDNYYRHVHSTERQLIILAILLLGAGLVFVYLFNKSESYLVLKEIFHKTLDAVEDGVLMVNKEGRITGVNTAFTAMSSFHEDILMGHNYHRLFRDDPFAIDKVLRDGSKVVSEEILFEKRILYATYPLLDDRKVIAGAIVVLRDVTQLRMFEQEREEAERLKFLGNLVANFAHEIKNPLNGVSIATQRLHKEFPSDNEEYTRLTSAIQREIQNLNKILNDFLSLARPKMKTDKAFSISTVLDNALVLIREHAHTGGFVLAEDISHDFSLRGNPDNLKRAFYNILLNAVDAVIDLPDRSGKISVITAASGDKCIVEIADNGIGMDDEDTTRIFTPYFTTKKKGTGLGLYIAQQIIKEHGGDIQIESEINKGTKFIITFS